MAMASSLAVSVSMRKRRIREQFAGRAETIIEDGDRLRDGVRGFLTKLPRDAVVYGIKLDKNKRPLEKDIEGAAGHVVLVEIELDA